MEKLFFSKIQSEVSFVGTFIKEKLAVVKNVSSAPGFNKCYSILLSDSTADFKAYMHQKVYEDYKDVVQPGAVLSVSGTILVEGDSEFILKMKDAIVEVNYDKKDVFPYCLDEERISYYIAVIKKIKEFIKEKSFLALVNACLTDENLKKMSQLPASLDGCGKYPGGALQGTAAVADMVTKTASSYLYCKNKLYTRGINWSVVLSAALLHLYGNLYYYEKAMDANGNSLEVWIKSSRGLNSGYFSLLQQVLYETNMTLEEPLSAYDFSQLINTLGCVRGGNPCLRAVSKEGEVLKVAIKAFETLDIFDSEYQRLTIDNSKKDHPDTYAYSDLIGCQIFVGKTYEGGI